MKVNRISLQTSLVYILPVIGFAFMFMLFNMYYMKFATDTLFLEPALVGLIFGLGRLWDAVTDPIVGFLSDQTRHRLGRRRPWLLFSAIPIGLTFVASFGPPTDLEGMWLSIWAVVSVLAFYTAMTAFMVPHMSLGAEMATSSQERSKLFGFRFSAELIGYLLGILAIALLIKSEAIGTEQTRGLASRMAILAAVVMAAMLVYTALRVEERSDYQGRGGQRVFGAFKDVWKNLHARRLLIIAFAEFTGRAVTGVMALYIAEYIIKDASIGTVVVLVWLVFSLISVPIWVRLMRAYGKRSVWLIALAISSLGYGGLFLLGEGDGHLFIFIGAVTGAMAGCGGTAGPASQGDVIDYDEYVTGERKEGTYFAAWNFVLKAAGGTTVMLAGFVLQASGFEPRVEQAETVKTAIISFSALLPFLAYGLAAVVLRGYSLTEIRHAEIRSEIDARFSGNNPNQGDIVHASQ